MNENNIQINNNEDIALSDFSSKISFCQKEIKNIEKKANEILYLKNFVINSTDKEERVLAQKINNISNEVTNSQNKIDDIIKQIKTQIDSNALTDNDKIDLRIKRNLFNSMVQKYKKIYV